MRDEDFACFMKCLCTFLCVISICIAASTAHNNYLDYQFKIEATTQGYEQHIENNFILWTKGPKVKAEQP